MVASAHDMHSSCNLLRPPEGIDNQRINSTDHAEAHVVDTLVGTIGKAECGARPFGPITPGAASHNPIAIAGHIVTTV